MEMVTVNANGQITLPAAERKRFGIIPGATLSVSEQGEGLFITKAKVVNEGVFEKIRKIAEARHLTSGEIVKMCREVRKQVYEEEYGT